MNIEERINSAKVTKEDLLQVSEAVHNLPEKERDFEGRTILMIKMFPGESDKCMAIDLRIMAMNELIGSGTLPGWAIPQQEDGSFLIAEPVWVAAAAEQLVFSEKESYFDPEAFLERVLSCATPEGQA
tara:strand:+ start:1549 stop:1932 length:384 start_codon:yes stop_codon:yes gene_type:complete